MNPNSPGLPQTRSFEKALLGLHKAQTLNQLGDGTVELMHDTLPIQVAAVFLNPAGFKESLIFARPEHLSMYRMWVREAADIDIWMRRCPPVPGQKLVRHTDHTPDRIFARSEMCRRMAEYNLRYGAAIQIWDRKELMALIIAVRSKGQGDFSDQDMRLFSRVYPYISAAVRRVFLLHKEQQQRSSLEQAIAVSEAGIVLLDSELRVLQFNETGVNACAQWLGELNPRAWKSSHALRLPPVIAKACRDLREMAEFAPRSEPSDLLVHHEKDASLCCNIRRIAIQGPSLDTGNFLLCFTTLNTFGAKTPGTALPESLSPREKELAGLIAKGKTNSEAAAELNKSVATVRNQMHTIFRKLKIHRRSELAGLWSRLSD